MIVTFPDNATIQIFVVPSGTAPVIAGHGGSELLLPAPVTPSPKRSRRRDVLFLGVGAVLCVCILMVVQGQQSGSGHGIEPVRAARLTTAPYQLPATPQAPEHQAQLIPPAPVARTAPPAPVNMADTDPTDAVRRLLAATPTITPPPGATPTAPPQTAPSDTAVTPAVDAKRNSFGMSD